MGRRNAGEVLFDVPLALDRDARFTRHNRRVAHGDRVLLLTDGVLEGRGDSGPPERKRASHDSSRQAAG